MGLISTPTTKARAGSHDVPLTEKEAAEIVGKARYELMRIYTIGLFEFAEKVCLTSDLIILARQRAYVAPYEMITGQKLPDSKLSDPSIIRQAVLANSGY